MSFGNGLCSCRCPKRRPVRLVQETAELGWKVPLSALLLFCCLSLPLSEFIGPAHGPSTAPTTSQVLLPCWAVCRIVIGLFGQQTMLLYIFLLTILIVSNCSEAAKTYWKIKPLHCFDPMPINLGRVQFSRHLNLTSQLDLWFQTCQTYLFHLPESLSFLQLSTEEAERRSLAEHGRGRIRD